MDNARLPRGRPSGTSGLKSERGRSTRELPEGLLQADAFVRGAAGAVSFGTADEIAAFGDTLLGRGSGTLPRRYSDNLEAERRRDDYDASNRRLARGAGELFGAGLLALRSGYGTAGLVNRLPIRRKGQIGEVLSAIKTVTKADLPVKFQVRTPLTRSYTVVDQRTLKGVPLEAKFGRSNLSRQQRLAEKELPNYRVDRWGVRHVAGPAAAAAGSAGYAASR